MVNLPLQRHIRAPPPFQPPPERPHDWPQNDHGGSKGRDHDQKDDRRATILQENQVGIELRTDGRRRYRWRGRCSLEDHPDASPWPSSWRSLVFRRILSVKSTRSWSSATSCRRASTSARSSGSAAATPWLRRRSANARPTGLRDRRNSVPPPNMSVMASMPSMSIPCRSPDHRLGSRMLEPDGAGCPPKRTDTFERLF